MKHNLRIASLLSFVAGIVNVAGFIAIQRLTTNVTGHFASLVDEFYNLHFWEGIIYFLFIFFFFLGSFTSNFIVEWISRTRNNYIFVIPTIIESVILFALALFGTYLLAYAPNVLACGLLFSMGLQNSLVTTISSATVRTTHLTGLFTDLGIELSQLFFYNEEESRNKLLSSIKLRLTIIAFFFFGGVFSGVLYSSIGLYMLAVAATILLFGLTSGTLKFRSVLFQRGIRKRLKH